MLWWEIPVLKALSYRSYRTRQKASAKSSPHKNTSLLKCWWQQHLLTRMCFSSAEGALTTLQDHSHPTTHLWCHFPAQDHSSMFIPLPYHHFFTPYLLFLLICCFPGLCKLSLAKNGFPGSACTPVAKIWATPRSHTTTLVTPPLPTIMAQNGHQHHQEMAMCCSDNSQGGHVMARQPSDWLSHWARAAAAELHPPWRRYFSALRVGEGGSARPSSPLRSNGRETRYKNI